MVLKDGKIKVAQYGQWDGYPTGQGETIRKFLTKDVIWDTFEDKIDAIKEITTKELEDYWSNCGVITKDDCVTDEAYNKFMTLYPELNRDTGAQILELIQNKEKGLKLLSSLAFITDSLFCEYAYLINLDNDTLEVYTGFNKQPLTKKDRFYKYISDGKYYPCKLYATCSFDYLENPNCMKELEEHINKENRT